MGNACCAEEEGDFKIYVRTGDKKNAGTDATVKIILHDANGNKTQEKDLDNRFRNDFERGRMDEFSVKADDMLDVHKVEFWRNDSGLADDWYLERIDVENKRTNKRFTFPVFRWIKPHHHYIIKHLDTSLPQYDEHHEQRKMELDDKRKNYILAQKAPGLPAQVKDLPQDESFSWDYKWDILKTKAELIITSKIVKLTSGLWESFDHLKNIYTKDVLITPMGASRWSNDFYFGYQKIASCNHSLLYLCKEIPEKLGVDAAMLEPLLDGATLTEALNDNRLFTIDLEILEGLPIKADHEVSLLKYGYISASSVGKKSVLSYVTTLCCPVGLFFLNKDGNLVPVAIQLYQKKGPDNPVFLPTDDPNTWLLAKMWFNLSDATYHQSLTHLGYTHLLMEGTCVCTHRNLSQSHPVFKLLAPHFLYLLAINSRGLQILVSKNGWVDKTMNCARNGMFELIKRGCERWRMDVDGTLPEELKRRGLDDPNILPGYHFRNDAILLYRAIHKYVTSYVKLYYDTDQKVIEDYELQAWRSELVKAKTESGVGLNGVPGDGQFSNTEELILVLTSVIYTCSVGHASTNFPQYDEYAFPPNYPGYLRGKPPSNKTTARSEKDILNSLPDKGVTLDIMVVTKILSSRGTKSLGNFEVQYIFDPEAMAFIDVFRKDLKEAGDIIKERNKVRNPPYNWLDPDIVPNSISI